MKTIYVCGPTVYSSPHIGNMRPIISFDIYRRALLALGEEVNFIHNITDIDDKIIDKAFAQGTTEEVIANKYEEEYKGLLNQSNVLTPSSMPRVTDNMDKIIKYIENLEAKGAAYESNGSVYFSVESVDNYGSVSNRSLDTMRFEGGAEKHHPADFALWKKTQNGIQFDSPWGKGRPGWHTECSTFIEEAFKGKPVDVHGGGIDLLFPHHENENAQHCAAHGCNIAKDWRHVGQLNLSGVKMSKSLGNILSAQEYFDNFSADTLRYIFLTASYSAPIDLNDELSNQAFDQVEKFRKIYIKSQALVIKEEAADVKHIAKEISEWHFANAMRLVNAIVKKFNKEENSENANEVIAVMELLGFEFTNRKLTEEEKTLIDEWNQLRKDKKFEEADKIRKVLIEKEIV